MYTVLAYISYLIISVFITVKVGRLCHQHGYLHLLNVLQHDTQTAHVTNNILLVAYYLVNIGYVVLALSQWPPINNPIQLIETTAWFSGVIISFLGLMHYVNIWTVALIARFFLKTVNH